MYMRVEEKSAGDWNITLYFDVSTSNFRSGSNGYFSERYSVKMMGKQPADEGCRTSSGTTSHTVSYIHILHVAFICCNIPIL